MVKIKQSRIKSRIFTLMVAIAMLLNSSVLAYGDSADRSDTVKIQQMQKDIFTKPEDTAIHAIKDTSTEKSISASDDNPYSLSIGEFSYTESKMDSMTVDSLTLISPYDQKETTEMSTLVALPDLMIDSIASYSAYPFTGLKLSQISVIIVNSGSAAAGSSICSLSIDGQQLGTFNVQALGAGYGVQAIITLPEISGGNHTIQAYADYNNAITESNEANNTSAKTFTWTGDPDISIQSLTASTATPVVGERVTFNVTIANYGNADANKTFQTDILINNAQFAYLTITGLSAGQKATGTFSVIFGESGVYTILLKADSSNVIKESNENNNTFTLPIRAKIADTVTITGTLRYKSYEHYGSSYTLQNLSNYEVKIYDKNLIGSTLKATVRTNSSGDFTAVINNETGSLENGSDIYFVISMDNSYLSLLSPSSSSTLLYQFESNVFENYQEATLPLAPITLDSDETMKGVFNIYHWVKVAKDYYQSYAGALGKVNIIWNKTLNLGSYFNGSSLYLDGADYDHYDSNIIVHEYGHYIMSYKNVDPTNAGGEHSFKAPSLYTGTAYSEAYATFISLLARNSVIYDDWSSVGTYYGANFETLTVISSNGNEIVYRNPKFYLNAKMELFIGGAMLDFADSMSDGFDTYSGGFNDVNNVVTSQRLNDSIEFYNAYMNKTSTSNKELVWKIFNQNNSAFDYTLPQVSITGNNISGYTAIASDNVGIAKLEWYLDSTFVGTGSTYKPPTTLGSGMHSITVRAYDYEGDTRGTYDREDINGNIIRTAAYSSALVTFMINTSSSINELPIALRSEFPEMKDFASQSTFEFSSTKKDGSKIDKRNIFNIDGDSDLYLTGIIDGAVNSINVVNKNGEIKGSIDGVYSNEYALIRNLPVGKYTLEIDSVNDVNKMAYAISMVAVPTVPVLDLPKSIAGVNALEINNPYSNKLKITVNQKEFNVMPFESLTIALEEGENVLSYYSENATGKSKITVNTVYCDTTIPKVNILRVLSDGKVILVQGQISEYTDYLYINGKHVNLGEFHIPGEPITFDYIITDLKTSALNIEAVDTLGNRFISTVDLQ